MNEFVRDRYGAEVRPGDYVITAGEYGFGTDNRVIAKVARISQTGNKLFVTLCRTYYKSEKVDWINRPRSYFIKASEEQIAYSRANKRVVKLGWRNSIEYDMLIEAPADATIKDNKQGSFWVN